MRLVRACITVEGEERQETGFLTGSATVAERMRKPKMKLNRIRLYGRVLLWANTALVTWFALSACSSGDTQSGCTSDAECKGDRVCVDHGCSVDQGGAGMPSEMSNSGDDFEYSLTDCRAGIEYNCSCLDLGAFPSFGDAGCSDSTRDTWENECVEGLGTVSACMGKRRPTTVAECRASRSVCCPGCAQ